MSQSGDKSPLFPVLVGLCAWLIPGGGYFLLGERKRAYTVFISVLLLFLMGILIGGIRIMDPPGWGEYGFKDEMVGHSERTSRDLVPVKVEPTNADQESHPERANEMKLGPALFIQPMAEVADKPWFVCQILCGPTTLGASAISVNKAQEGVSASHARSWEVGALYTAVAGMLNLLVIIDATYRAAVGDERPINTGGV